MNPNFLRPLTKARKRPKVKPPGDQRGHWRSRLPELWARELAVRVGRR